MELQFNLLQEQKYHLSNHISQSTLEMQEGYKGKVRSYYQHCELHNVLFIDMQNFGKQKRINIEELQQP